MMTAATVAASMRAATLLLPLLLVGCVSYVHESTNGQPSAPVRDVVLVDQDFAIPAGQDEVRLPYHLAAPAEESQAKATFRDATVRAAFGGPGGCADKGNLWMQVSGSNSMETACGALPAGDGALVLRVAQGPASGRATLTARVRG